MNKTKKKPEDNDEKDPTKEGYKKQNEKISERHDKKDLTDDRDKEQDEEKPKEPVEIEQTKEENKEQDETETNQRVAFNLVELCPEDLVPHPVNATLYGNEEPDKTFLELVDSIRTKGLLEPLLIDENNVIISGHRRWRALLHINQNKLPRIDVKDHKKNYIEVATEFVPRKAKCQVVKFKNESEKKLAIIEYNRRRIKRYSQMYNEIEMLHEIYDSDALENSIRNLKEGPDTPTLAFRRYKAVMQAVEAGKLDRELIDWKLSKEEIGNNYIKFVEESEEDNSAYIIEQGETRKRIANALGIGRENVRKLECIGRLASNLKDEVAIRTMKNLDKGLLKINGAYIVYKLRTVYLTEGEPRRATAKELVEDIEHGIELKAKDEKEKIVTPVAAMRLYNDLISEKKSEQSNIDSLKPEYSVLYLDFPVVSLTDPELDDLPYEIKNIDMPAANDAALLIAVNTENIKHAISLMKLWDFKLKSFTAIEREQKGLGNWFVTGYDILLFSTRGKWSPPAKENQFSGDVIRDKRSIPDIIKSMYPDVQSFYQLNLEQQPIGWGIPIKSIENELQELEEVNLIDHTKDDDTPASPAAIGRW